MLLKSTLWRRMPVFEGYPETWDYIEAGVTTPYAYNPMRMMKEASEAGVTLAKYEYDALGRRIISWLDDEWRTVSLWSVNDSIYEIRQEWTTPPPNPPTETITRYVAVNGQYLAKLVGGYNSTQKYFHHTDIVGTVRAVTDIYGAVVARYAYEPFGSLTAASGLIDGELHRFTGNPSDLETSLSYFNARYYDPTLGRFTSSDPARDGLNWFVYCDGNPISFVDPSGNKVEAIIGLPYAHLNEIHGARRSSIFPHAAIRIANTSGDWVYSFGKYNEKSSIARFAYKDYMEGRGIPTSDIYVIGQSEVRESIILELGGIDEQQERLIQNYCESFLINASSVELTKETYLAVQSPIEWSMFTYTCSTFVCDALEAGGYSLLQSGQWNPYTLFDALWCYPLNKEQLVTRCYEVP